MKDKIQKKNSIESFSNESSNGGVTSVIDSNIVVSDFELQSH